MWRYGHMQQYGTNKTFLDFNFHWNPFRGMRGCRINRQYSPLCACPFYALSETNPHKKKPKTHTFPSPVRFSFVFMKTVHSKSRPCTHQPTRMSTKAMFLNRGIQTSRALVKQLRKGTKNAPHHVRFTARNAGGFCGISYLGWLLKCVGPLRVLLGPKKNRYFTWGRKYIYNTSLLLSL